MNDSYGRSVVPNANLSNSLVVAMEAEVRRPLSDRQTRSVRTDMRALSHESYFTVPAVPVSPYMYAPRLDPRNMSFHQAKEKNDAATVTGVYQDTWRDMTVQRFAL